MGTDRPRRRCTAPYCPRPARDRGGLCLEHERERDAQYERHRAIYTDPRWRELSRYVLDTRPICQACKAAPSTDVDHAIPLAKGGAPFDEANAVALCRRCHARKTAREVGLGRAVPARQRRRRR
jgi:5-methylcytosine-specific restriction protein A